ncbi:hypothetical protein BACCELL_04168 [Bacteroides cellulosilyticus DSM 14838]|jgi:hypothetical protein|uniref:DegT/DnrJ/EryC1/StrS aminotransferase family protein n=2 Tax=Bacteroides cellulosilyticus TaxID=246787 RepID=E2NIN5_9BACE|nr:hypothetical protein BACCELL_04168 [Bacteroides cellulosilyticus DSM 14838]
MVKNMPGMRQEIGGYFSFELNQREKTSFHSNGIYLNSGRNALEYILLSLPRISKLWIPYFTCDVILEPLLKLGILYNFYHINERLEICEDIQLESDEYLLVTNYYGIKDKYIQELSSQYSSKLIVDNAQALFAEPIKWVKSIYSPRKYIGIPDGGIAYIKDGIDVHQFDIDVSYDRCSHLLKRIDLGAGEGYMDFKENSYKLQGQPIKRMSRLTQNLFQAVNFDQIRNIRRDNFRLLHGSLSQTNKLPIPDLDSFSCPMVYPYYTDDCTLKKRLIENKVFIATYWPNVFEWCSSASLEYNLADGIIAIPVDQRYTSSDMSEISSLI